jgi:protein SCO1/2
MWVVRMVALATVALSMSCSAAPTARQYELEGQVLALRIDEREVLIKHGDIKGFMPGMTMPFRVRDPKLLDGRQVGDLVRATLVVEETEAWLDTLEKTGFAPVAEAAVIPAASFVEPAKAGDATPDAKLIDQTGATLTLQDYARTERGDVPLAITFIYIRCPLPQFCPMLDRRFSEVQKIIKADSALNGQARLLSVSFDPDADTTERLAAHAARLHADPAVWRFATAPRETVDRLAAGFGVNVIRERDGTITHNMRTAVVGADGTIVRVYDGSEWTPQQIANDLRASLAR